MKRGKNIYTCNTCGRSVVTIDRHDGKTPSQFHCREALPGRCGGTMQSSWYQVTPEVKNLVVATHEWHRPTRGEMRRMRKGRLRELLAYVAAGGMLLRRRNSRSREGAYTPSLGRNLKTVPT